MNFESIVSKIVAGGLTAGIFLFWWPTHFATDGIEPLILRGLLSTLFFELVLISLAPIEARVTERLQLRRVAARLEAAPERARAGGVVALACLSVGAPLALLSGGPHQLVKKPERVEVVREVVVEKPVVERRVIVKRVTVPAAPATRQAATPAPERTTPAPAAAAKTAAKRAATAKRTTTPAATTTAKTTTPASEPVAVLGEPAAKTNAPATTGETPAPTQQQSGTSTSDATGAEQPAPATPQP